MAGTYLLLHRPFIRSGLVDFAMFDASASAATRSHSLRLLCGGRVLTASSIHVPVVVIASYLCDSLPCDMFMVSTTTSGSPGSGESPRAAKRQRSSHSVQQCVVTVAAQRNDPSMVGHVKLGFSPVDTSSVAEVAKPILQWCIDNRGPGFYLVPTDSVAALAAVRSLQVLCCVCTACCTRVSHCRHSAFLTECCSPILCSCR